MYPHPQVLLSFLPAGKGGNIKLGEKKDEPGAEGWGKGKKDSKKAPKGDGHMAPKGDGPKGGGQMARKGDGQLEEKRETAKWQTTK